MFSSSHTLSRSNREILSGQSFDEPLHVWVFARGAKSATLAFYPFPHFCMEASAVATKANKPLKVFRLEDVSVSVFANERTIDGDRVTFYNVSMSKTYKKGNETRRTQSFGSNDIAKLIQLLKESGDFVDSVKTPKLEPVRVA